MLGALALLGSHFMILSLKSTQFCSLSCCLNNSAFLSVCSCCALHGLEPVKGKTRNGAGFVFYDCSRGPSYVSWLEVHKSAACHLLMLRHHVFHIPGPTFYCQLVPVFVQGLTCRSVRYAEVSFAEV